LNSIELKSTILLPFSPYHFVHSPLLSARKYKSWKW